MRVLVLLAFLLAFGGPSLVRAANAPPPPPDGGNCPWCSGPPPPPTPVPTASGSLAPLAIAVEAEVRPSKVHRGQTLRLFVEATQSPKANVVAQLQFHSGKRHSYHKKLSSAGKSTFKWTIAPTAPLGQGTIRVKVSSPGIQQPPVVNFTVLK